MSEVIEVSRIEDMKRRMNQAFINKAHRLCPTLVEETIKPRKLVTIQKDASGIVEVSESGAAEEAGKKHMKKGDSICLDFGNHYVGYVTLRFSSVGSHQDAPAYIRLKFGEVAGEILEDSDEYEGWISRGWIQEEYLHIDVLPAEIHLPRRYAFRYLEIHTIATSRKWELVLDDVTLRAVSAVDESRIESLQTDDPMLERMDVAGLRTLKNCMQYVYEDGPKRDRRLWLGDLRLQALANYETFEQNDLVKRCLYLFAGMTRDDGRVTACLYIEPEYLSDDVFFFDYSLFFISCLYDYYEHTGDEETLRELWPCAKEQILLGKEEFDENHLYQIREDLHCFIDWKANLDKQAAGQAVYIYCLRQGLKMAQLIGDQETAQLCIDEIDKKSSAALQYLWDEKQGLFVSGNTRQISYASQAWMVLAEVVTGDKARGALLKVLEDKPKMGMVTPYMNHHFTEALFLCGEKEKALEYMKYYWGGMTSAGADTFWELYNPENPKESPYGSSQVNSYCHAWSCTPSYLLRKYIYKAGKEK